MCHENVDQVEDVEVAFKVNGSHVAVKEDSEADRPYSGCVPPMPQPVFHNDEASCLAFKLLDIRSTIDDKQTSKYLGTKYHNPLVCLCKQVQQPLSGNVLGKAHNFVWIVGVAQKLGQKLQNGDAEIR